jgi:predicted signal transduction protein with EAL and GGDEF domain
MSSGRIMLPAVVAAAVALIAITNYAEIILLARSDAAAKDLLPHFLAFGLPTSVAVILVLSTLYHAHRETVLEMKQRAEELLIKAQRDKLTGLANREYFEAHLADAVDRFERYGELFALLLVDLDHFKRVNDLHGHHMGDTLLQEVSSKLTAALEPRDLLARLGGASS